MERPALALRFDSGTILLDGADRRATVSAALRWNERVSRWRAPASAYRQVVKDLVRQKISYQDQARSYHEFEFRSKLEVVPRPYQQESIDNWRASGRRGVVILPTGAGK